MRKFIVAALIVSALTVPIAAHDGVSLHSAVFIERLGHSRDGRVERTIEPARDFRRGDRLVLVVEWKGRPAANGFAVTSPIPRTIAYEGASEEKLQVSVDGGKSWGKLGAMQLRDRDGARIASPNDVTHLRWKVSPDEARRGRGRITYSAVVR